MFLADLLFSLDFITSPWTSPDACTPSRVLENLVGDMKCESRHVCCARTRVSELARMCGAMSELKSQVNARFTTTSDATKKKLWEGYVQEITSVVNVLQPYIGDSYSSITIADGCETLDKGTVDELEKKLHNQKQMWEHHNSACKAAKTKFTQLLMRV